MRISSAHRALWWGALLICTAGCTAAVTAPTTAGPSVRPSVSDPTSSPTVEPGRRTGVSPGAGACSSRLSRSDESTPRLRVDGTGSPLFTYSTVPAPVRANPGDPSTRWTGDALPAPPDGRPTMVFYSPHPDDETLSAGVLLAQAAARGARIIIVALTDGADTHAILAINRELRREYLNAHAGTDSGFRPLTPADIGTARLAELRRAATALGVDPGDVYAAHLDAPSSDCGSIVSIHEADQVERAFAARFPLATHVTMSYDAERQQDHLAAGVALLRLRKAGVVTHAQWVVSRLWWTLPSPAWHWVVPVNSGENELARVRRALQNAVHAYTGWDPATRRYGIGGFSVRSQFDAMSADQRDRLHGLGANVAGDRAVT